MTSTTRTAGFVKNPETPYASTKCSDTPDATIGTGPTSAAAAHATAETRYTPMNSKKVWGHIDRWLIRRGADAGWYVLPPGSSYSHWRFPTGAEALAAFAKGEQQ